MIGVLRSVERTPMGSALTLPAAPGDMTLQVEFGTDFNEDGGTLSLNDNLVEYATVDNETDIVTLVAPLVVAAAVDDPVTVIEAGVLAVEWTAHVAVDEGEPVPAVLPTSLIGYFPEGEAEEDTDVEVALRGDEYEVVRVLNQESAFDGRAVWNPHAFRDIQAMNIVDTYWATVNKWTVGETDGLTIGSTTYTIQYPGVYFISVQVAFALNGTGSRRARVMLNDTDQIAFNSTGADSTSSTYVLASRELRLVEEDFISVDVWQNSGATLALNVVGSASTFSMHRVSV